jgi:hypothetical protein
MMNETEALLTAWRKAFRASGEHFVTDGIVCEEGWHQAEPRVLFILGAPDHRRDDLCRHIRDVVRLGAGHALWKNATYHNLGRWAYGLMHFDETAPSGKTADRHRKAALLSIALIHLRKTGAATDPHATAHHARTFAPFLKRQIEILNPDIVVLCETLDLLKKHVLPELTRVEQHVHQSAHRIFLEAPHPSRTRPWQSLYAEVLGRYDRFYHRHNLQGLPLLSATAA